MKTFKALGLAALVTALVFPASALIAQPPDGPGGFGGGPGRGPGGDGDFPFREFMFGRLAEELELSEGQKAEIEALRAEHRDQVEPLIEQARVARHAVGDLMRSDAFDEETIRAAARQAGETEVELIVIRARHLSEVRSLLTPEQQEKAAELREDWRERGERFRGSRGRGVGRGQGRGPGGGPARW